MNAFLIKTTVCIVSVPLFIGCASQPAGIAPSTLQITGKDAYTVISSEPAVGRSWGGAILGVPIFEPDPSMVAKQRAINNSGADALIEVCQDNQMVNLMLASIFSTRVKGTPVKFQRRGEVLAQ
jgi:hypothetical protein